MLRKYLARPADICLAYEALTLSDHPLALTEFHVDAQQSFWKYYKFSVKQRIKVFNFFVVLCIFVDGGVFAATAKATHLSWPFLLIGLFIGFFVVLLVILFWLPDNRSRELIELAQPAIETIAPEVPPYYKLLSDALAQSKRVTYTSAMRILFVAQLVFGIGVAFYCAWRLCKRS
jgi:hypothetical protein